MLLEKCRLALPLANLVFVFSLCCSLPRYFLKSAMVDHQQLQSDYVIIAH